MDDLPCVSDKPYKGYWDEDGWHVVQPVFPPWEHDSALGAENVRLEVQGNFAAIAFKKLKVAKDIPKRGKICEFSQASRLRLLKLVNRLDPERAGRATFMTQTWRDDGERPTKEAITSARSHFQEDVESVAHQQCCGIWRVEWKRRQSGSMIGLYMPHVHSLYFDVPWMDQKRLEKRWASAIGVTGDVSFRMKECVNLRMTMYYVSKYIAKRDFSCRLDIPSYLTSHFEGRHWGNYRPELLPFADKAEYKLPPGELVAKIRAIAKHHYNGTPDCEEAGFSVFGPAAQEILEYVENRACLRKEKELD